MSKIRDEDNVGRVADAIEDITISNDSRWDYGFDQETIPETWWVISHGPNGLVVISEHKSASAARMGRARAILDRISSDE